MKNDFDRNADEWMFIIIMIAILVISFTHDRDVRLLDARITNIEAAKP